MDRYCVFRKLMDFIADVYEIVDADMKNFSDEIEITGVAGNGDNIQIIVRLMEGESDGT